MDILKQLILTKSLVKQSPSMHSSTKQTSNPFFLYKLQALRFTISYLSTICIISVNCLLKIFIFGIFFRSYNLNPTTKSVYPVTLSEVDKLDLVNQDIVPYGLYKNHFFDYKDSHIKSRVHKDDVSEDSKPLCCVCGTRRWHITDESTVDPDK